MPDKGTRPVTSRHQDTLPGARDLHPMSPQPTSVSVEIVRGCNLDCPMCLTEREDEKVRRMSHDLYRLIVGQLRGMGLRTLRFCGDGEQSLHPSFAEFVAEARAAGIETVGVVTNGTRLLPPLVEQLFQAGLGFMAVSVDAATEPTYRSIRRGRHSLAEVEENINIVLRCRKRWGWKLEVQVNYVVQPLNLAEVGMFKERWEGVVDQVNLLRLTSQTSSRLAEYGVFEPCYMLRKKLYVSVDGDIYPCFYLYAPIIPMGNVQETTIGEVWAGRRETVSQDPDAIFTPLCRSCTYTDEHWRPDTPVLPYDMEPHAPLNTIRVFRGKPADGGS